MNNEYRNRFISKVKFSEIDLKSEIENQKMKSFLKVEGIIFFRVGLFYSSFFYLLQISQNFVFT